MTSAVGMDAKWFARVVLALGSVIPACLLIVGTWAGLGLLGAVDTPYPVAVVGHAVLGVAAVLGAGALIFCTVALVKFGDKIVRDAFPRDGKPREF